MQIIGHNLLFLKYEICTTFLNGSVFEESSVNLNTVLLFENEISHILRHEWKELID